MQQIAWRADPLVWGYGSRVFEIFLEPTCPFSVKALGKLDDLLAQAGEDRITVKIRLQSQPWHMYSSVVVRCILAASTLENGKEAARAVMAAVAAHRQEFEFDQHCSGPILKPLRKTSSRASNAIVAPNSLRPSRSLILTGKSNGIADTLARTAFTRHRRFGTGRHEQRGCGLRLGEAFA